MSKLPHWSRNMSVKTSHNLNGREEKDGGDIVLLIILCHAVNAIVGSALQGWMEQTFLHILFISIDIGRKIAKLFPSS